LEVDSNVGNGHSPPANKLPDFGHDAVHSGPAGSVWSDVLELAAGIKRDLAGSPSKNDPNKINVSPETVRARSSYYFTAAANSEIARRLESKKQDYLLRASSISSRECMQIPNITSF
jgi:hypothetical protein